MRERALLCPPPPPKKQRVSLFPKRTPVLQRAREKDTNTEYLHAKMEERKLDLEDKRKCKSWSMQKEKEEPAKKKNSEIG